MDFSSEEILETIRMVQMERMDIRCVTLGIDLHDCVSARASVLARNVHRKVTRLAGRLVRTCDELADELGLPIVNKRVSVTPVAELVAGLRGSPVEIARALDQAAESLGIDYIGGYSALVHKSVTRGDAKLIDSIPEALAATSRLCGSVNVASTRSGINMDAVRRMGEVIKETARRTARTHGSGCTRLAVFANAVEDNPFMAGAFHGSGEGECVVNVGVSGPGVVRAALARLEADADLGRVAELIKRTAFKISRVGELVGREVSRRLGVEFGIIDLSLAPSPVMGDSVAEILELMGLERCGTHGTTAALSLMVNAVKTGGAMASSYVGGLSGAFIPISEDEGMVRAVRAGALGLPKLEALTAVCSVGIDMVALPGKTSAETVAGIIADEMAIGVAHNKTTGVRVIPVPGARAGQLIDFGGLLGTAPVMTVSHFSCERFVHRGGRIPAPLRALTN